MQLQQYRHSGVPVPAADEVLQRDARGVLRADHVEYLVLYVVEVHRFSAVGYHLFLDCLVKEGWLVSEVFYLVLPCWSRGRKRDR